MGWKDLLQTPDETTVLAWVGGRSLQTFERTWRLKGKCPAEHGWHTFRLDNRTARWDGSTEPQTEILRGQVRGYLVGDRLVPDDVQVGNDWAKMAEDFEQVHLLEPGLDRFVRVVAGRVSEGGPLIFEGEEFPLGPEDDVLQAYLDEAKNVDHVAEVAPALDGAFRFESWQRKEAERRRREERERREAEERQRALEERRLEITERLGDSVGRREMALIDFAEAARAALAIGNAKFLDHRKAVRKHEIAVRFRFAGRRFECTCDERTLRIIDAGICLVDHATGRKDDNLLTLESLPGVIQQAQREHKLVVFRHV